LLARKLFQGNKGEKVRETVSSYQTLVADDGTTQTVEAPKDKLELVKVSFSFLFFSLSQTLFSNFILIIFALFLVLIFKTAIENAASLSDIQKLENALISGSQLPLPTPNGESAQTHINGSSSSSNEPN
jgi:hypothetical protein